LLLAQVEEVGQQALLLSVVQRKRLLQTGPGDAHRQLVPELALLGVQPRQFLKRGTVHQPAPLHRQADPEGRGPVGSSQHGRGGVQADRPSVGGSR
jgi:hypothetical protein